MRFPPSSLSSVGFLLCLGLPIAVGHERAGAGDPPSTATILGTVVRRQDGAPAAYADVSLTGIRPRVLTDDLGGFVIRSIPAGRVTIRIQAPGWQPLLEDLELAPGDTLRRTFTIGPPARDRFREARDSLTAIGRWPPTLDPALEAHMRGARNVHVFRLDPEHAVFNAPPDPRHRIGPWPIVREAGRRTRAATDELIETLLHSELYEPKLRGEIKLCGGFSPGIDVRFVGNGEAVDVLLCYRCGEFSVWQDGKSRQAGDFEGYGTEFVRFAKRVFPGDREIKKLNPRIYGPAR